MNGTIDLQAESIYRGSLILVNREYGYRERAEDLGAAECGRTGDDCADSVAAQGRSSA